MHERLAVVRMECHLMAGDGDFQLRVALSPISTPAVKSRSST